MVRLADGGQAMEGWVGEPQRFRAPRFALALTRAAGLAAIPPGEQGYKDIVALAPDESATLLVHFDGLSGKYYYHCHVYEHEDRGMMGTFEVEASATSP